MRRSLLLFLFLSACASKLWAQTGTGILSGSVQTSDGQPAQYVSISITGTQRGAIVDEKGHYSIDRIQPGTYIVEAKYVGLQTQKKQVTVTAGEQATLDFVLQENHQQLQEVLIESRKTNPFSTSQSPDVAKISLKNLENPQVYNVVTKELIQDQMIVTYSDIIKNVPGVILQLQSNSNAPGGTVATRGFSGGSYLRNGLPGMTVGILDPISIETLEAVKGPSGTLFGSSLASFGGLFNRVSKKPFDEFKGNIGYTGGSFGLSRLTADINTPLNEDKTLLFRITGAKHDEGSFQDAGFQNYTYVAPSLLYKLNDKTSISLDGEYMSSKANSFYRLFVDASNATGAHNPDGLGMDFNRRYIGDDIYALGTTGNFYAQVDHQLSETWKSQTNFSYSSTNNSGMSGYLSMLTGNQEIYATLTVQDYGKNAMTDIQQNFTGDLRIGNLRNRVLIGLDYYHTESRTNGASVTWDTISVANPGAAYGSLTRAALLDRAANKDFSKSSTSQNTYSAYVQDVINLTDALEALLSVRLDRFENGGTKNEITQSTANEYGQTAFSPKFGLVYQPIKDKLSVFANYMNGFQNLAPMLQPDQTYLSLDPQKANQFEGGIKLNLLGSKLSSTISYYDIRVDNVVRPDPDLTNRPGYSVQDGSQYSKGIEADVAYNPITGLNIIAGYSYNNSKYTRAAADVDGLRPPSAGPGDMVNAWVSYRLSKGKLSGLGLGFGGNYASGNITTNSIAGTFTLPSYTVLNATVYYDQPRYRIGIKANNLNDEHYFIGWVTTIPQAPRNFMAEFVLKFGQTR